MALQYYLKRHESGSNQSGRSPENPFNRGEQWALVNTETRENVGAGLVNLQKWGVMNS